MLVAPLLTRCSALTLERFGTYSNSWFARLKGGKYDQTNNTFSVDFPPKIDECPSETIFRIPKKKQKTSFSAIRMTSWFMWSAGFWCFSWFAHGGYLDEFIRPSTCQWEKISPNLTWNLMIWCHEPGIPQLFTAFDDLTETNNNFLMLVSVGWWFPNLYEWEMVENHQRSMAKNGCLKVLGGGLYTFLGCFNKNVLSFWRIEKNSWKKQAWLVVVDFFGSCKITCLFWNKQSITTCLFCAIWAKHIWHMRHKTPPSSNLVSVSQADHEKNSPPGIVDCEPLIKTIGKVIYTRWAPIADH